MADKQYATKAPDVEMMSRKGEAIPLGAAVASKASRFPRASPAEADFANFRAGELRVPPRGTRASPGTSMLALFELPAVASRETFYRDAPRAKVRDRSPRSPASRAITTGVESTSSPSSLSPGPIGPFLFASYFEEDRRSSAPDLRVQRVPDRGRRRPALRRGPPRARHERDLRRDDAVLALHLVERPERLVQLFRAHERAEEGVVHRRVSPRAPLFAHLRDQAPRPPSAGPWHPRQCASPASPVSRLDLGRRRALPHARPPPRTAPRARRAHGCAYVYVSGRRCAATSSSSMASAPSQSPFSAYPPNRRLAF